MPRKPVILWVRKEFLYYFGVVLLLLVGLAAAFLRHAAVQTTAPLAEIVSGKTVVIDPGHGGDDPGCSGNGLLEKDVNLDIALRVKRQLNRLAIYGVLTRDRDMDPLDYAILRGEGGVGGRSVKDLTGKAWEREALMKRLEFITKHKADLFISIHANTFPSPIWSGAQTFYSTKRPENMALAVAIQEKLVERLGPNYREAKEAQFFVLNKTDIPAALVEIGFLSNPEEAARLKDPAYREKAAEAIVEGIVTYLVQAEKGIRTPAPLSLQTVAKNGGQRLSKSGKDRATQPLVQPKADEVVVYFGGSGDAYNTLVPEIRRPGGLDAGIPVAKRARIAMEELIKGPGAGSGLQSMVPARTRLRSLAVKDGLATVDFDKEVAKDYWGGSWNEELTVYSIVNTLTAIPGIDRVQILIEGEPGTIGGHILLDEPLARHRELISP
ncbi:MAG: N-acetylmuramoyl-L-alanine amidase [Syntrophothermus sp.]